MLARLPVRTDAVRQLAALVRDRAGTISPIGSSARTLPGAGGDARRARGSATALAELRAVLLADHRWRVDEGLDQSNRSVSVLYVALTARLKLVNGDTHRIELPDDDPAEVFRRLNERAEPFDSDWVDTGNGELVRLSAIVSMYVEPGGGRPLAS